jgi:hypothetical protein
MVLPGGLYPLKTSNECTISLNQAIDRRPEVTGEQLAASFGVGDRRAAVARLVRDLLLANLGDLPRGSQLAAEGTLEDGQLRRL